MAEEVVDQAHVHALHDQRQTEQHAEGHPGPVLLEQHLLWHVILLLVGVGRSLDEIGLRTVSAILVVMDDRCLLADLDVDGFLLSCHGEERKDWCSRKRKEMTTRGVRFAEVVGAFIHILVALPNTTRFLPHAQRHAGPTLQAMLGS